MIINPDTFCKEVEHTHAHENVSMFDSIFRVCDNHGVDYDMVGSLVNRSIREKVKNEAVERNLMKCDTIPLF